MFAYEIGRDVERLVENRQESVPLALEDLEPRVRDELDLLSQEVDAGEGVAIAAQK